MLMKTSPFIVVAAMAYAAVSAAQTPPPAQATERTVVAATKLPTVVDKPLHFRALNISIPQGQKASLTATDSILYQLSGSTQVAVGEDSKTLTPGTGLYLPAGKTASLTASGGASTALYFSLTPAADGSQPVAAGPASVRELYRTAQPLPGLKAGTYDLNLTRVTFPAGMPSNNPHHRTGGALYYIVSGTGANTVDGKTEPKPPGSLIYEPFGLVHQWGNPGAEPLTFLSFNINQEGVPAVAQGSPK